MRIRELDGLRGIAILAVLDNHYLAWYPRLGAPYGGLGVDLFFVLSGFLITSILLELRADKHYFRTFYSRRALRIFPPYFLALAVYFAVSVAMGKMGMWKMWLSYVFYYASLFPNLQAGNIHGAMAVPVAVILGLGVTWSLSVEELYYTFWAPVVRFAGEKWLICILAATIIAAPILRLTVPYRYMFTFYCRMDGLAYGSAIALLVRWRRLCPRLVVRWDRVSDGLVVAFFALAMILGAVFGAHSKIFTSIGITIVDISFAFLTYALVRKAGGGQWWVRMFRAKWLRSLGMVSYSLYLFHYPLAIVAEHLVGTLHLPRRLAAVCNTSLGLALSLAVAYGLWYGMESRILRWKDRHVPKHLEVAAELARS